MVRRILRAQFATGQFDRPAQRGVVDVEAGLDLAQRVAERGTVLLKNDHGLLPLNRSAIKSIAIIGSHADIAVLSGGGSAQVDPPGGNAVSPARGAPAAGMGNQAPVWLRSSPLKAIQAKASAAKVTYDDGANPASAAMLAKSADLVVLFVSQHASEGRDLPLVLPDRQDDLVTAVAAANAHTIVVLETGGPVNMPWADHVPAILEAWYPGIRGGQAIANILFGEANPSGKTVVTFARNETDWPHNKPFSAPESAPPASGGGRGGPPFDIPYTEGLKVGYKWFDASQKVPLFEFGRGLSYTSFSYSNLEAKSGQAVTVSFSLRNSGKRDGIEVAQVYASLPPSTGEPPRRLVAWEPVFLKVGESRTVNLTIDPLYLSVFNEAKNAWVLTPGEYHIQAGSSSRMLPLDRAVRLGE
jgi:beta-glucosidase